MAKTVLEFSETLDDIRIMKAKVLLNEVIALKKMRSQIIFLENMLNLLSKNMENIF
jgi:hypothetical protein